MLNIIFSLLILKESLHYLLYSSQLPDDMKRNDGFERSNNTPKFMNPAVTGWIVIHTQIGFIPAELCTCRDRLDMQLCDSSDYPSENPSRCFWVAVWKTIFPNSHTQDFNCDGILIQTNRI